ncbi:hypothetical protein ACS0TY_015925 [Phlomoides rotata]
MDGLTFLRLRPDLNQICKRSWIVNKTPSSLPLHRPTKQTSTKTLLLTNILFPYAYSSTHRSVGAHIRRKEIAFLLKRTTIRWVK